MKKLAMFIVCTLILVSTVVSVSAKTVTYSYDFEDIGSWDLTTMLFIDDIHLNGAKSLRIKPYGGGFNNDLRNTTVEPWGALSYNFNYSRRTLTFNYDGGVIPAGDYKVNFWAYDPTDIISAGADCPVKVVLTFHGEEINDGNLGNGWGDEELTIAAVKLFDISENSGAKATGATKKADDGKEWKEYSIDVSLSKPAKSSAVFLVQEKGFDDTRFLYLDGLTASTEIADETTAAAAATTASTTKAPQTADVLLTSIIFCAAAISCGIIVKNKARAR